ncbi:AraC family transcriptional regulator [Pedobacter yulinensis]|uniref:AraC family transcriptional regulator n=1 Tax=Pedobacter yulinensis TaxID=2126353 RepID=A0A2T3HHD7_9SPHI|nr:AraC family transcriptional regulator [Pedobacter yulinensis]PST81813.1 AraC family transcriptional regulator [Pedobacter yulinensis]
MYFKLVQPPPHLADYVRFFWFAEGDVGAERPYVHHAFAYTCPEFSFCYKGQFQYRAGSGQEKLLAPGVYGQTQHFSTVATTGTFGIFAFYLYPHALPQLFNLPATLLTDCSADMKTLFGREGEILEEQMMLARDNDERIRHACTFLEQRLGYAKPENLRLISFIRAMGDQPVHFNRLSAAEYLSVRQFERRFKHLTGFRPKLFFRISRFNALLNRPAQGKLLTQLAHEHGYYDQAHFIHDFKIFSGHSPKAYFNPDTMAATDRGTVTY